MEHCPSSSSSTSCAPWRTIRGTARPSRIDSSSTWTRDAASCSSTEAAVGTPIILRPWKLVRKRASSQVGFALKSTLKISFYETASRDSPWTNLNSNFRKVTSNSNTDPIVIYTNGSFFIRGMYYSFLHCFVVVSKWSVLLSRTCVSH